MPSLLSAWVNVSCDGVNPHAPDRHDFLDALCNAQHHELLSFDFASRRTASESRSSDAARHRLVLFVAGGVGVQNGLTDMTDKPATEGPTFSRLKSLYLGEWLVADFYRPFAYLCNRAPNLATLCLDQWKLYEANNGIISGQVSIREKPTEKLNLSSALSSDLEVLRLRISKGDDAGEFSTLRRMLKE